MLVCPRWEKVRRVGPHGVGPPLLLNRFRGHHVTPCAQREYVHRVSFPALGVRDSWIEPEHVNVPASLDARHLRRAMGLRDLRMPSGYAAVAAGWRASQQLPGRASIGDLGVSSAVAAGDITISTVNIGTGARALFPNALTLTDLYFFIVTSPTNTTLQYNVGAGSNTLPTTPATPTLAGPTNVTTVVGWTTIPSLSLAFAADTYYWAWLSDSAAAQATSGVVRRNLTGSPGLGIGPAGALDANRAVSTATDYWATAGNRTFVNAYGAVLFVFSGAGTFGSPFTSVATSAADTNEKGLRLSGLTAAIKLYAAYQGQTASNNLTGLNVYSGTTAPSGTGDVARTTVDVQDSTLLASGFLFATPPTLNASTTYHITHTFSASAVNSVRRWQIGTGADATLKAAMFGGGPWYYARANGTTDFANDATDEWPRMLLEIEDLVAAAGGGGMLVHPGMVGGLRG